MIKILERLDQEKGFEFERAFVRVDDFGAHPVGVFGGVECLILTKPALLEAGIACCNPVNGNEWPLSLRVEVDGQAQVLNEVTADEMAVKAARKFMELAGSGWLEDVKDGTGL